MEELLNINREFALQLALDRTGESGFLLHEVKKEKEKKKTFQHLQSVFA